MRGKGGPCRAALVTALMSLALGTAFAQVDSGRANFDRYVAIGDSYGTAFVNGSVHQDAQVNSYPALIHRSASGNGAGFEQPLISDPGVPPVIQLVNLVPPILAPKPGLGRPVNLGLPRPYNNLSVPGADTADVLATVTGGLHELVLRGLGTQLEQALVLRPTFVSVWIGGNDALAAVVSGRVIEDVTLTSLGRFESNYRSLLGSLASSGAGLVVGTLPTTIEALPFASTVPPVVVNPLTGEAVLIAGQPVALIGPDGPLGAGDFVLLSATPLLARGIGIPTELGGTGRPLPTDVVLSSLETAEIEQRVSAFNEVIRSAAGDAGAAVADIDGLWERWAEEGVVVGGVRFTPEYLTGGLFGFDGVHLSPTGYALFANEFIRAINQTFDSRIPMVDLHRFLIGDAGTYPGGVSALPFVGSTAVLTRRTLKNLRYALGIPRPRELSKLAR